MSAAYTPGPWDVDWWESVLRDLHNFLPDSLREPRDEDSPWGTRQDKFNYPGLTGHDDANARLIAAAPEMYDTLEKLRADLAEDDAERHAQRIAVIDLTLAEARGEA